MTKDEMAGWHHRLMNVSLSELWELAMDREALRAVIRGVSKDSDMTEQLNWTERSYLQIPSLWKSGRQHRKFQEMQILSITCIYIYIHLFLWLDFLRSSVVKNPPANAGDASSTPKLGRSLGEGNGNPFQYSYLENPLDGEAWYTTVHGISKSWTRLSD